MKEKDFVFKCYKCEHNIYVSRDKIEKLLITDCPECGEEGYGLWTLLEMGTYK